jgi:uncharacterized protein (DUF2141 family)
MKKLAVILLFIVFAVAINASEENTLSITFKNIKPAEGQLMVALCNSAENFEQRVNPYKDKLVPVTGSSVTVTFTGLPAGEYGVKTIHDKNSNTKMDTNLVGIPTEGFGFSNDVMGSMGPPKFKAAKFSVNGDKNISITLKYM